MSEGRSRARSARLRFGYEAAAEPIEPDFEIDEPARGALPPLHDRVANRIDLLVRNVAILERLEAGSPRGILRLSSELREPIHKVRHSLKLLQLEGAIVPTRNGAVPTPNRDAFWIELERGLERIALLLDGLRQTARINALRSGSQLPERRAVRERWDSDPMALAPLVNR